MKLYTNPRSRGRIIEWYLKELGVEAELVNLDFASREHKSDSFLKINPFGQLPTLEDGSLKLAESGAILLYLAEKYGGLSSTEQRARAAQWILFANSTLGDAIFFDSAREKQLVPIMEALDKVLAQHDYIDGPEFSVADAAMASTLSYSRFFDKIDLSPYSHVEQYVKRALDRPAAQATIGASTG